MAKSEKPTIEQIRKLKTELKDFHATRIQEQQKDQSYYDDTFDTRIKSPYHERRTGSGARVVDSAVENIVASNPQVFRNPRKPSPAEVERAAKIAKLGNHWVVLLIDEIVEGIKNAMVRGECWFQIEYNENFDPNNDKSLPILITAPDPMIILADPYEVGGMPRQTIKTCNMSVGQVQLLYPEWPNPRNRKYNDSMGVEYLAWWNKDWRYFEADGEPLLQGGVQKNILGFVPFIHCYSGFGKKSPEGKPESLAVGRLRKIRHTLEEECEQQSRLDSQIALFSDPVIKLRQVTADAEKAPDEGSIEFSPGRVIVVPYGWEAEIYQGQVPSPQQFQYLYLIKQTLGIEVPPVAMGLPSTSRATGRQEDIYAEQYSRKYDKLVNGVERSLATALGMGLRILNTVPGILPITVRATTIEGGKEIRKEEVITKQDIDGYYDLTVKLRPESELVSARRFAEGKQLIDAKLIDWKTFLVEYCGKTEDRAEEIILQSIADLAIFSPDFMNATIKEAMEKLGMQKQLKQMEQQATLQTQMAQVPSPQATRPSEAKNPLANEILRQTLLETPRGTRRSPQ